MLLISPHQRKILILINTALLSRNTHIILTGTYYITCWETVKVMITFTINILQMLSYIMSQNLNYTTTYLIATLLPSMTIGLRPSLIDAGVFIAGSVVGLGGIRNV